MIFKDQFWSPLTNTKSNQDHDQIPPLSKDLAKVTRLSWGATYGSSTSLFKLQTILSSWINYTPHEVITSMSEDDFAYFQKLYEAEKMKLFYEVSFYTYQAASLFSLVTVGRGDVLAMGNPTKGMDTWKGKFGATE